MRLATLEVIRKLTHDITAHEALAERLDQLAAEAFDEGSFGKVEALRLVLREYRFRAMQCRGRRDYISDKYQLKYQFKP